MKALAQRIKTTPADAAVWADYGVALRCAGHLDAAISAYRRSLGLNSDQAGVLSNLGGALRAAGRIEESIGVLHKALALIPGSLAIRFNLGLAYEDALKLTEALEQYEFILRNDASRKDAAQQRAFTLLKLGRLEEGFAAYEDRLLHERALQRNFKQPKWDGSSFAGKTLLLHSEQGLGDTFQFIRYAAIAKARGGKVVVECQKPTLNVVKTAAGVDEVIPAGSKLPPFDLQASLMSLPFITKTAIDTIPSAVPYLTTPPESLDTVRISRTNHFKIGIVWASGHADIGVHARTVPLCNFLPLLAIPNIALYSLQVGDAAREICKLGCENLIEDLQPQLIDFGQTADAIRQMDLIISVDTAVPHLAGAMAKPIWVLLPYASEWRWLDARSDSPWYPTITLFRQERPHDWDEVFARVLDSLCALARDKDLPL